MASNELNRECSIMNGNENKTSPVLGCSETLVAFEPLYFARKP